MIVINTEKIEFDLTKLPEDETTGMFLAAVKKSVIRLATRIEEAQRACQHMDLIDVRDEKIDPNYGFRIFLGRSGWLSQPQVGCF